MRNACTCHKLKFKEYYELLDLLNDNDKKNQNNVEMRNDVLAIN